MKSAIKSAFPKSVFGVASSRVQASRIVNHLANAGFSRDNISVLLPDEGVRRDGAIEEGGMPREKGTRAAEFVPGRMAGMGAFPLPRFNHFMAGGPFGGMLSGAAVAPAGPEVTKDYYDRSVDGHLLICLRADEWGKAEAARKIFQAMGASNVTLAGADASRLFAKAFLRFESEMKAESIS
jgi:hypothetical protein